MPFHLLLLGTNFFIFRTITVYIILGEPILELSMYTILVSIYCRHIPVQYLPLGARTKPSLHTHSKLPGVLTHRPFKHRPGWVEHSLMSVSIKIRSHINYTLSFCDLFLPEAVTFSYFCTTSKGMHSMSLQLLVMSLRDHDNIMMMSQIFETLTLLHSDRPYLYGVMAHLSATGLMTSSRPQTGNK